MKELTTGIEIKRARQSLEHASATILGQMIFAFSRLDVALALHLVWSNDGSQLIELTKKVEILNFWEKLDFLQELVTAKYEGQKASSLYRQWLADTHATRTIRNELVHGRWGTDPMKNEVVNVVGLPTSSKQRSKGYTISALKSALKQMEQLQVRLTELREKWPV
jgi:hypothetical protein